MGTSCVVCFAIIYLHIREQKVLETLIQHTEFIWPTLFKRYIDDFFMKFDNLRSAELFILEFNHQNPNTQLPTAAVQFGLPDIPVNYLDCTFVKSIDGKIRVAPYCKPSNAFQYLHARSHHKLSTFDSFIQSKLNRFTVRSSCFPTFVIAKNLF